MSLSRYCALLGALFIFPIFPAFADEVGKTEPTTSLILAAAEDHPHSNGEKEHGHKHGNSDEGHHHDGEPHGHDHHGHSHDASETDTYYGDEADEAEMQSAAPHHDKQAPHQHGH